MAGDWIKLEHATLEKPEVALFSEFLGVSVNEGLGILLRFWFWLDRNSRNGVVTHTSRLSIEGIVRCAGFAAAIEAVGWAKFDDAKHEMRVPNFDRHNGNTAKTRALGKDRASRLRNAQSVTKPLPEKRREEKRTTTAEREARARVEAPTSEHTELARKLGLDGAVEWQKYLDHQANAKHKHVDLKAGFNNWLRRAREFAPLRPAGAANLADKRAATAQAMFGSVTNESSRDITGESERVA